MITEVHIQRSKGFKTPDPVMTYCKNIPNSTNKHYRGIYRQYLAASAALLSVLVDGTFTGWLTPCLRYLGSDSSPLGYRMSQTGISWMASVIYVGQAISPIPTGYLMDSIGRKATLIYLSIIPITAWVLVMFAKNVIALSLAMFMGGLWIGVAYTVTPMYLGEIAEPSLRGRIVTLSTVVTRVGIVMEIALGLMLPYNLLPIVSLVIPLVFLVMFPFIPESPYYYLMRKDRKSASESLCWLRGGLKSSETEKELSEIEESVNKQMSETGRFIDLVKSKGNRKALITVETLAILQRLSGMGPVMSYLSITLPESSLTLSPPICALVIDSVRLLSGFISSFLVDFIGRRSLLLTSSLFCGVMMGITGTWFYIEKMTLIDVSTIAWLPFVCLVMHGLSFSLGLGPVCSAVRSEFFPMNIKAKSSAITSTVLALASFVINKAYIPAKESFGMHVNYWVYGFSCLTICVFAFYFLIETKGKSLQQIQDELHRDNSPIKKQLPTTKKEAPPIVVIDPIVCKKELT